MSVKDQFAPKVKKSKDSPDAIHVSFDHSETVFVADRDHIVLYPPEDANVELPEGVAFVKLSVQIKDAG